MKNVVIIVLAVALIIVGGLLIFRSPQEPIGASTILSGVGVKTVATNFTTSTTLTAKDICDNSVVNWFAREGQSTTTLPSALTLRTQCLSNNGDSKTVLMRHTGWASSTITFSGGTGDTVQYTGTTTMRGGNSFLINFISLSTSTAEVNIGVEQQ